MMYYIFCGIVILIQSADVHLFWIWHVTGQLPQGTSSVDVVLALCGSIEFLSDQLLKETSRVLKPGGTILVYKTSETDKVIHVHTV